MLKSKLGLTVRVIQVLASSPGRNVSLANVSQLLSGGVSVSYLEQIAAALSAADIVKSTRGPGGGYQLNIDPHELTLGGVSDAVGCSDGWLVDAGMIDFLRSAPIIKPRVSD